MTAILEGLPAGVAVDRAAIDRELRRRQVGYGRGGRMQIESDQVELLGGVRHGLTLGSPVCLRVSNRDWPNWSDEMGPDAPAPGWSSDREFRVPRPGHADLAGAAKYGHHDLRNVLERASARETAARVAVGAVCRGLLDAVGIRVLSGVRRIGGAVWDGDEAWTEAVAAAIEASDVRCGSAAPAAAMHEVIDAARMQGDTLGGIVEVRAQGVPAGLGSHVAWDRRLDARLAAAIMGIPAIKGVEFGLGFGCARVPGSLVHDPVLPAEGRWPFARGSNHSGGIEGGISNGEEVVLSAAMKPIPTLMAPLASVDLDLMEPAPAHAERSDVCAVPAAAVVAEAVVCHVLANELLEKFGGDHLDDLRGAMEAYQARLSRTWGPDE